jgi:hypothetical protein
MFGPVILRESAFSEIACLVIGGARKNFSGNTKKKMRATGNQKRAAGGLQRVSEVRPWWRLFMQVAGFSTLGVHFQVLSS